MVFLRMISTAAFLACSALPAAADNVTDAIDEARKAYEAGNLGEAKQALDQASQLIREKNAESFASVLPAPLPGWKAEKTEASSMGSAVLGVSMAKRHYTDAKGNVVKVTITGDSALIAPIAAFLANTDFAGVIGKTARIGNQRAVLMPDGDINMIVANKFLVSVHGSAPADAKMAYARAVDVDKLAKM